MVYTLNKMLQKRDADMHIIHTYTYIYIYIYIYIYNIILYYKRVTFQFLPNLQRLDKITKSVKSINLKTN